MVPSRGNLSESPCTKGACSDSSSSGRSEELARELEGAKAEAARSAAEAERLRGECSSLVEEKGLLIEQKNAMGEAMMEGEGKVLASQKAQFEAQQAVQRLEEERDRAGKQLEGEAEHLRAELALVKREVEEERSARRAAEQDAARLAGQQAAGAPAEAAGAVTAGTPEGATPAKAQSRRGQLATEREQKLIVSVLYDLSMELHRTKMYQRANSERPPLHSWLAKHRNAINNDTGSPS
eukprot:CAMPEP_0114164666 /NCGR_PEP_ID=MMETSP0043_2-20121206/30795_1 /TAXON_ID=464988 /ORGANISM="Hemiselmis andersenii, Strain CCMP644" /LENGTH=237 /DNA_ID=CAMNT_0001261353 /DNA_START=37 /DNA_END=750 /DNA_ORIENTATION=+